jgi:cell division septation protein DedD
MRGKILFVAGAAVGYVLGARAGRKRYEQIKSAATKVWESPGIQKQVDSIEDFVAAKVGDVPGALYEGAKKLIVQASNRRSETYRSSSSSASTALIPKPSSSTTATETAAAKPATAKPSGTAAKSTAAKPATKSTAKPAAKPAAKKPAKPADDASA